MTQNRRPISLKGLQLVIGILLIISVFVFVGLGFSIQYQDMQETYTLAKETTSFIKTECQKFDNYTRGNIARTVQELLGYAQGLNNFISSSEFEDDTFLWDFIHTEHIGGVIVLDRNKALIAQADMDHQDGYTLWEDLITGNKIEDILQYPQKTYVDHVKRNTKLYDVAVTASKDGSRLVICYSSAEKPSEDPYELTLKSILDKNSFYKDPTLVLTDGTQVLSTNSSIVEELGTSQYAKLVSSIQWKDNALTRFQYQNVTYYGMRQVYGNYHCYAVYSSNEVFTHRTAFITYVLMAYLSVMIVILAVQRHFDKVSMRKMEKQLRIIQAISTAYSSTFLLHTDTMTLEAIHPSQRLKAIYAKHTNPYDFLFAVCKTEVDQNFYSTVMHFLDLDTIAERLKGNPYLGCEVKDSKEAWFSVLLIPQKTDEKGDVTALLVTTRDITSLKKTEELTFKDQLTGLYNRNYMEARSDQFVRSTDFPVSLIMADCNYLKRTNDTLGHEYGDLLLQRVANILSESVPENAIAMRVGGDEFLIVCTRCTAKEAHEVIETIRKKLKERSDSKLTLSVSFGVSTTEKEEFSFKEAYEEADREMYKDKKASRIQR